jgi:hypothetical protein
MLPSINRTTDWLLVQLDTVVMLFSRVEAALNNALIFGHCFVEYLTASQHDC